MTKGPRHADGVSVHSHGIKPLVLPPRQRSRFLSLCPRADARGHKFLEKGGQPVLPISGRACARAVMLPAKYPRDPADRVIGATALVEGVPLITADREIRNSRALQTIW